MADMELTQRYASASCAEIPVSIAVRRQAGASVRLFRFVYDASGRFRTTCGRQRADSRATRRATSGGANVTAGCVTERTEVSTPARPMSSSVRATDHALAIYASCFPAVSAAMYGGGNT